MIESITDIKEFIMKKAGNKDQEIADSVLESIKKECKEIDEKMQIHKFIFLRSTDEFEYPGNDKYLYLVTSLKTGYDIYKWDDFLNEYIKVED